MEKEYRYDVLCIGIALVDSIIKGFDPKPVSVSGYRAQSCSLNAGGEAVNESMAASKLGLKTAILCVLGSDMAADLVKGVLSKAGVDTSKVVTSEVFSTPVTTMFVNDDGTRKSVNCRPNTTSFRIKDINSKAVILGSLFRFPFDDPYMVLETVRLASGSGSIVLADTKIPNYKNLVLKDYKDSLPYLDYITPNEDEARYLTGMTDPAEAAQVFLDHGVRNVIIKLGKEGCLFRNAEREIRLPAIPVKAIDSTGAGDNFIAGFVSEILRGESTEDALKFANACGAICTTAVGAGTALRDRQQVLDLLGSNRSFGGESFSCGT